MPIDGVPARVLEPPADQRSGFRAPFEDRSQTRCDERVVRNLTGAAFEHVSDANTLASKVELESAAGEPASANKLSRLFTRRTSRGVGRIPPTGIHGNRTSPIVDACSTNGTGS